MGVVRARLATIVVALVTVGGGLTAVGLAAAAPSPAEAAVCSPSQAPGVAHCNAIRLLNTSDWRGQHVSPTKHGHGPTTTTSTTTTISPTTTTTAPAIPGFQPADLQSAYNLPSLSSAFTGTARPTVAIVDAYNDPYALSDVRTYRSQFYGTSVPSLATGCSPSNLATSTTPCFLQLNQSGGTNLPRNNSSWSQEISLDLDMVSAVCPYCNIMLVEASSASMLNLATAAQWAINNGATVVSNSYGSAEFSTETTYDHYYTNTKGVVVTVSSGDGGYGVDYPAAIPGVVAVGGTSLSPATNSRGWTESVWSTSSSEGAGSGCSAYEPKPSWQYAASACPSNRVVADVSAVADPATGVAVYDTYGQSGWLVFGGTSVASPIIASVVALAGNATAFTPAALYSSAAESGLNPVTTGQTASCGSYLCNANAGYNLGSSDNYYSGPVGVGTPNGVGSF